MPVRPGTQPPRVPRLSSLSVRIVAAFATGLLAMSVAMGVLVVQYQGVSRSQQLITDGYLPLAKSIARLTTWQARIDNDVRRLLLAEREGERPSLAMVFADKLVEEVQLARGHARSSLALTSSPEEVAALSRVLVQLTRIQDGFGEYRAEADRVTQLSRTQQPVDAEGLKLLSSELGDEVQTLSQQVDGRITQLTRATEAARRQATAVAIVLATLAMVIASLVLWLVLRALRPIGRLTSQVQRLAAGDYSGGTVEVRGDDEVSILAGEFNAMVDALRARDAALVQRAEQLNTLSRYLANVVDSLQEGLFVIEGGEVTLTNPAARETWGEALPDTLRELLHPDARRAEVNGPDRSLHEVRLTPFGDGGWVVSTADVTEATLAKERLARSERLALVGQMLAQITHEVRNPLNALSLNTEMLADELGQLDPDHDTEAWDLLALVAGEIDRLTAVTGHYLQLARRPRPSPETLDLPALLRDIERLLHPDLIAQGVTLTLDLVDPGPLIADGNQLRQAVLNVVRNATEAGADTLHLSLRAEGTDIVLALQDNGPGMEDVERATDPFYSTKPTGTGLGLAITRQILEDHDGSVRATSVSGQGTELALVFPRRT